MYIVVILMFYVHSVLYSIVILAELTDPTGFDRCLIYPSIMLTGPENPDILVLPLYCLYLYLGTAFPTHASPLTKQGGMLGILETYGRFHCIRCCRCNGAIANSEFS